MLPYIVLGPFFLCLTVARGQDHCWVKYIYDAAGNRVERKWWCGDPHVVEEGPKMLAQTPFGLMLAPNPTQDLVVLSSATELANATVTVTAGDGRTVHTTRLSGTRLELDASGYDAGTYTIMVLDGVNEYQSRFTVIH